MSARWQIYAVLICNIYVRSRIERLCNALVAAGHKGNALVRAQIFAHVPGSYGISQFVPKRRARDRRAHRVVLQPCAATSVSHNSLPQTSVWVPGREFSTRTGPD